MLLAINTSFRNAVTLSTVSDIVLL